MQKAKAGSVFGNARVLLFLIVIFGLFLRLIFFSGMGFSDDLYYSRYASSLDKGIDPNTLAVRIGILYPTQFFYSLFGVNDFSSVLFVLLTSLGSIVLAFYFGKLLFNEKTGLMASFLISFFPLDIVYSTKLLTDIPSAFFMALGVYLFLYSEMKGKRWLNYFFSGILIGIGYLIRESALLIALFFIVYIIYNRKIKKEYFLVPLGILLIFALESLLFYNLTGQLSFRTTSTEQWLAESLVKYSYYGRLDFPMGLLHYPYLFLTNNLLSFFYIFVAISIVYCIVYRKKESYAMLFWLIPLSLYISFGSGSLTKYFPFRAVDRYLEIVTIPAMLLLGFFLTEKNEIIRKAVMPTALALLLLASIGSVYLREDRGLLSNLKEVYGFLEKSNKAAYADERTAKAMDYVAGYKSSINIKAYPDDLRKIKDAYVIVNQVAITNIKKVDFNAKFPEEIEKPPQNWAKAKEIGKGKGRVTIYYAS